MARSPALLTGAGEHIGALSPTDHGEAAHPRCLLVFRIFFFHKLLELLNILCQLLGSRQSQKLHP